MRVLVACFTGLLAGLAVVPAVAQPLPHRYAVVIRTVAGMAVQPSGPDEVFFAAEVVDILATRGETVQVRALYPPRSAWLSRNVLADGAAFQPLPRWSDTPVFEMTTASADSGQTYRISRDGTFRARFTTQDNSKAWSGRMYRYGDIFWARPDGRAAQFDAWNVFRRLPAGGMCTLNFDTPLGCECIGTADSGVVASCR